MSYDPSKVAFIDTETTGLDPDLHQVWEIGVIVDGIEHVWQQKLDDDSRWAVVDQWVIENTGILQRYDHSSALTLHESSIRLSRLVEGRHLVGACPWFDSERLHAQQRRETPARSLFWHYHLIDVEVLAVGWLTGVRVGLALEGMPADLIDMEHPAPPGLPWSSSELSKAVGVDPDDFLPKHSALADARWAKAMFEAITGSAL